MVVVCYFRVIFVLSSWYYAIIVLLLCLSSMVVLCYFRVVFVLCLCYYVIFYINKIRMC